MMKFNSAEKRGLYYLRQAQMGTLGRPSNSTPITEGPIQKGTTTKMFEEVIKHLLLFDAKITKNDQNDYIVSIGFEEDQRINVNLTNLLKIGFIYFPALEFDEACCNAAFDIANRSKYCKPKLPGVKNIPTAGDYRMKDSRGSIVRNTLWDLTPGECACINNYTGHWYEAINGICHGNFDNIKSAKHLKEVLVYTAITAYAVSKGRGDQTDVCYREVITLPLETVNQYIESLRDFTKPPIIYSEAFLSTGVRGAQYYHSITGEEVAPVTFVIENARGRYIENISQYKNEREFLMPPGTQIILTNHCVLPWGSHIFYASAARSPDAIPATKSLLNSFRQS